MLFLVGKGGADKGSGVEILVGAGEHIEANVTRESLDVLEVGAVWQESGCGLTVYSLGRHRKKKAG
jgi:hypothetical protein